MASYLRDGKEYNTRELIATYYSGVSLPQGYDFTRENTLIFDTPKPTTTQLEKAVREGVEVDTNGNTIQKWKVVDMFSDYINDEGVLVTKAEQEEAYVLAEFKKTVPKSISNSQARQALALGGLYATVNNAIVTGTDEALQIRWEYEVIIKRDDAGLIAMATALGLTEKQLDDLFILGATL